MIGQQILHYKILEKLGEGGMGVVYKAEDTKLKREVAIKFLPRHIAGNAENRERFKIEAQAAAALNHPNIATIHAIEENDDDVFIVMEYIDGRELQDLIAGNVGAKHSWQQSESESADRAGNASPLPLPLDDIITIAMQIASGLQAAHAKGIIHRDIKSSNIMVTNSGRVKIMDFGLAKIGGGTQLTKDQSTLGTAAYMSPEQAGGEAVDHRSDIWSFGVVLYEMLTGQLPFGGEYEQAVIYSILNEAPDLSPVIESYRSITGKALSKKPEDRFPTATAISEALAGIHSGGPAETGSTREQVRTGISKPLLFSSIIIFLVASIVIYFVFSHQDASEAGNLQTDRKKIVILPFENLGAAEDEYFADGITEEITSRLATVPQLGVIGRTSAIQYKRTEKTIAEIGDELDVDYILEGTVRWDHSSDGPSRVRVTPQLIQTSDATHLWAGNYNHVLADIFAVQSDIAVKVIEQLDIALLKSGEEKLRAKPTENLDAYQAYLQGKDYLNRSGLRKDDAIAALEKMEQAVTLDPEFALAYVELSNAHSNLYHGGHDRTESRLEKAKAAVERAFEIDPDLPEAHVAFGLYYYRGLKDYDRALSEFGVAEKEITDKSSMLELMAAILRRQGHCLAAIQKFESALELSPRDAGILTNIGMTYEMIRNYHDAERYYYLVIEAQPDELIYFLLARVFWNKSEINQARQMLTSASTTNPFWMQWFWFWQEIYESDYSAALDRLQSDTVEVNIQQEWFVPKNLMVAMTHYFMDNDERARPFFMLAAQQLEKKLEMLPDDHRIHSALGIASAGMGKKTQAIRHGQKAIDIHPISQDAMTGPYRIEDLAFIYALVDEPENALDQIDHLLSIPSHVSVDLVKIDPKWNSLRENPRFRKIIAKYSGAAE